MIIMADLPTPFVAADVDLKDFAFTPIYRARLFGSAFHARATDAEWRAGVTLWLKSQDQVPAGTLPDDDVDLCRLAELGRDMRSWKKIKTGAIRGWIKCSDGRLHHKVVAEIVNDQWLGKLRQRWATECARQRKECERKGVRYERQGFDEWRSSLGQPAIVTVTHKECHSDGGDPSEGQAADVASDNGSKGQGQGQGNKKEPPTPTAENARPAALEFEFGEFWKLYPRRDDKGHALKAYRGARRKASAERLTSAAKKFADECVGRDPKYIPLPATWLNGERWEDQGVAEASQALGDDDPLYEAAVWRALLREFSETRAATGRGYWPSNRGVPPGRPGCQVPRDLLAEFDLSDAVAA